MFKVSNGNGVHWVGRFNDLVYLIENLITSCLIKAALVVEIEEVMDTCEESLGIEAWQFESLNLCHGSKGPWLEVSSMLLVQHKY
jgi:hypothetical protein